MCPLIQGRSVNESPTWAEVMAWPKVVASDEAFNDLGAYAHSPAKVNKELAVVLAHTLSSTEYLRRDKVALVWLATKLDVTRYPNEECSNFEEIVLGDLADKLANLGDTVKFTCILHFTVDIAEHENRGNHFVFVT